jgi:hypothetical protein
MDLPNIEAGMRVLAEHINRISREVRANAITAFRGGTFQRTGSGTVLSTSSQFWGGGGGGTTADCSFRVTDVSETTNEGVIMKLNVACEAVMPEMIWPPNTGPEAPDHVIQLGELEAGWYCVWLAVDVEQQNKILTGDSGIYFGYTPYWPAETSVRQRFPLAGVTISLDAESKAYISNIENYCPLVAVKPAPTCPFLIENEGAAMATPPRISIRSTKIHDHYYLGGSSANRYPSGMDGTHTFTIDLNIEEGEWQAVYCLIQTNEIGRINAETSALTLTVENGYRVSTSTQTWFLLGEVNLGYDEDSNPVIEYIANNCADPFIAGAVNTAGNIQPRGKTRACFFEITDTSTRGEVPLYQVDVSAWTVANRWPNGMNYGTPVSIPVQDGGYTFIYCAIHYVPSDVVIGPLVTDIEIISANEILANTADDEYVLLGFTNFENGFPTFISTACGEVIPNPCNLNWSQ